eukprot:CAMPEP_0197321164 /NCGR_PEP_ID=MMETSP0891-20130614/63584_1 /TAXON_ID=44058 ORGANISM="Aureoumbra lagunensis, Strain CCMP1510" /NCGR_SAMPLE_ID=MMETSP0891 /ASSEMBLY_ACC=CAM_ASM_000534 /LENGTH=190 /DNA_ID=CAMNT_0042812889 /DNA_START=70 /DNA_END=639 /DNA_ORIENTATION=+
MASRCHDSNQVKVIVLEKVSDLGISKCSTKSTRSNQAAEIPSWWMYDCSTMLEMCGRAEEEMSSVPIVEYCDDDLPISAEEKNDTTNSTEIHSLTSHGLNSNDSIDSNIETTIISRPDVFDGVNKSDTSLDSTKNSETSRRNVLSTKFLSFLHQAEDMANHNDKKVWPGANRKRNTGLNCQNQLRRMINN